MHISEPVMYIGPNRRSEKTIIEWRLRLTASEHASLDLAAAGGLPALRARLEALGCSVPDILPVAVTGRDAVTGSAAVEVGKWVCAIALAMQQAAGHRVGFGTVLPGSGGDDCRLIFEYEHLGTGADAGELALRLLTECIPGLQWQPGAGLQAEAFEGAYRAYLERAREHVLPLDAQAIINAAAELDVPCVKLERDPYGGLPGDFRIRRNGLLKLGHSCFQHVVDGTLCLDRNAALVPLLFDREALFRQISELRLPAPRQDPEFRNLITAKRAIRAARKIGYPVVIKPVRKSRGKGLSSPRVFTPLHSDSEVQQVFEHLRDNDSRVIVEQFITGVTIRVLLANHEPACVMTAGGSPLPLSELHDSILEMAVQVSKSLGAGLLALTLVTPDPGRPLTIAGGAVVALNPAPQLDVLLAAEPQLMARAAEGFVRWLYPPGVPSRTPLVAVTGTNGKTTTSRMIARIARTAGFRPGMASTSGVYFNEVLQQKGDLAGSEGHHLVFESHDTDLGVLETARGAVAHSGFMFDWCDVAVCTNVTEDHIGEYGIDTLEQMTALKRSILERARRAVVLNADYATCREMLPFAEGLDVYLTSLHSTMETIRDQAGGMVFICVLEEETGEDWLILYEPGGSRLPVMPVAGIPATLQGAARFNVSNSQHAICACHGLGLGLDVIRQGLGTFENSFENTPGRLNIYRQLPFTVIMDYAHNLDGLQKLCEFVDRLNISGRKLLLYALSGNRLDQEVMAGARAPVGHFDHFFCRSYPTLRGREPGEIPALMKASLLDAGVPERQITTVAKSEDGVLQTMRSAHPGDLVVLTVGADEEREMWRKICSFQPEWAD